MLSSVEIYLISFFVAVLSVVEALGARFYLRDFPWQELLLKQEFFGGAGYLLKRFVSLICWLVLSIVTAIAFAFVINYFFSSPGSLFNTISRGSSLHYFFEAMPTILAVAFYIGLCDLLKAYTKEQQESNSYRFLSEKLAGNARGKSIQAIKAPLGATLFLFLKRVVGFIPYLFYRLYRDFYFDTGRFLTGASNLLVTQYGPETVVRFFEHQQGESHPYRAGHSSLDHLDDNYENSLDWAQYLLTAHIRQEGYFLTRKAIKRYVNGRKSAGHSKREAERIRCKKPIRVAIRSKGQVGYAKLLEYSEGYRGFYITTNLAIDQRERINITINDTEYTTRVVHQNCFIAKERIFSGYGLSLAS